MNVRHINTQRLLVFAARLQHYENGTLNDTAFAQRARKIKQRLYCEDDEVTRYVRRSQKSETGRYPRGVLGAIARALLDNVHSLQQISKHPQTWAHFVDNGEAQPLFEVMIKTGCQISPNYLIKTASGMSKLAGVIQILKWFRDNMAWKEVDDRLFNNHPTLPTYSVKTIARWLQGGIYIGEFLSGEIAYELSQQVNTLAPPIMRQVDCDTFATYGHSTLRGIARLDGRIEAALKRTGRKTNVLTRAIHKIPIEAYCEQILKDSWEYFPERKWRMREVVRCLALFDIYERQRLREIGRSA